MVSQFYPPVAGGQEQYVRNLAQALVARGHRVGVATIQPEGPGQAGDGEVRLHSLRTSAQRVPGAFTSARKFAPPVPDPEAAPIVRKRAKSVHE